MTEVSVSGWIWPNTCSRSAELLSLLALTFLLSVLTLGSGHTTVLHVAVHLVILATSAYPLVAP